VKEISKLSYELEDLLHPNRPRIWRWVAGTVLIIFTWQVLGFLFTLAAAKLFDYDVNLLFSTVEEDMAQVRQLAPWSTAATVLVSFIPLFVATLLAYRIFLKRHVKQLFTSREKYSWGRTWIGFASFAVISLVFGLGDFIINQDAYTWSWDAARFFPYLLVAFTLLPIQTTAEELFFRGWLQQWLANGKKRQWSISLLGGFFFALPHMANPEVAGNDLYLPIISYGAVGFMLAWVTFRDKTLELAIGAHFANNLLAALLVSSADSALPSASLFITPEIAWAPAAIVSVVMVPIFIWLTKKWSDKVSS
jgi:membrane protease YdiL (CAAX protease family)